MLIDNEYEHCGTTWIATDCDSFNNDECPECRKEITPFQSVSYTDEGEKTTYHTDLDSLSLRAASAAFGCELPYSFLELSENEQEKILEESPCDKFDGITSSEYFELIDAHSDTIKKLVKKVLSRVKSGLVDAAIECDLPSDFNELDLHALAGIE
jgi:hypothetical protein